MLLKDYIHLFTPGRAPTSGQSASTSCPPPPPPGGGSGGHSGSGDNSNCYLVPIVTGHNPDGTLIISGFGLVCP